MYTGPPTALAKRHRRLYEKMYLDYQMRHRLTPAAAEHAARRDIGQLIAREEARKEADAAQLRFIWPGAERLH